MTPKSCPCGHRNRPRTRSRERYVAQPLSTSELLEPHRLVALLTTRPELSGVGLVRLAEATLECA